MATVTAAANPGPTADGNRKQRGFRALTAKSVAAGSAFDRRYD